MSIEPLITFKAGKCDVDTSSSPWKVRPESQEGYIYLYVGAEDEMTHFCWRKRSAPADEPDLDLLMIPGDGTFAPYTGKEPSASSENVTSPVGGRIYVLKFSSSSQRHLFWLQSASQHPEKKANWFSPRDLQIGQIVDMMLQGEEVDVRQAMAEVADHQPGERHDDNDDDDEDMDDAPGDENQRLLRTNSGTGGAGADATGGDIRDEGEHSREGGEDGGRADPSSIVQNFLRSLGGQQAPQHQQQQQEKLYTTLPELLGSETTIPVINNAPEAYLDRLLSNLPPQILIQAQEAPSSTGAESAEPTPDAIEAAIAALSAAQKRSILTRVLRSPQLHQSLASLNSALRDGGLPLVAQSLGLDVENGGMVRGGNVPLGGGNAVEAFVEGVKKTVEKEDKEKGSGGGGGGGGRQNGGDSMDTS